MTSAFEIEIGFHGPNIDPDAFGEFLDSVMDELEKIGRGADMCASLAAFTASFTVNSDDLSEDSLISALGAVRTALHAANCSTPSWPASHEIITTRGIRNSELAGAGH